MKAVNRQDHKMSSTKKPRLLVGASKATYSAESGVMSKHSNPRASIFNWYYLSVNPNKEAPANGRGLPIARGSDLIPNGVNIWNYI